MSYNEYSSSRQQYRAAWERAEALQDQCESDSLLVGVIYDTDWRKWIVTCVDTKRWIKEKFHGGHRAYSAEVWRENDNGTVQYSVPEQ